MHSETNILHPAYFNEHDFMHFLLGYEPESHKKHIKF
jgi:hypothetical protein